MVGNDVVDLRDADATSRLAPRFDARVFGPDEIASLDRSPDRSRRRWRLWAAKEAAYKAAVKLDAEIVFSPVRFRVRLDDDACEGRVETPVGSLVLRLWESQGAVHGVARTAPARACAATRVVEGMTRAPDPQASGDPEAPGRRARRLACERVAAALGLPVSALEVRKRGRIPELWIQGRRGADLSLSHHGGVVGFACDLAGWPGSGS